MFDWGYDTHPPETFAFALRRSAADSEKTPMENQETDLGRIRRASFAVTVAFEARVMPLSIITMLASSAMDCSNSLWHPAAWQRLLTGTSPLPQPYRW